MTSDPQERTWKNLYLIGRSRKKCDIVIASPVVSSVHAVLFLDSMGHWFVRDRESRNGTFIDRGQGWERFREGLVKPGQKIAFANIAREVSWLIEQAAWVSPGVDDAVSPESNGNGHTGPLEPAEEPPTRLVRYQRDPDGGVSGG